MRTSTTRLRWLAAALAAVLPTQAALAKPSKEAEVRASLYQAAIRAALEKHAWHVLRDEPGKLVADHVLYVPPAAYASGPQAGFSRVAMVFSAKGATDTGCMVSVADHKPGYFLPTYDENGKRVPPPLSADQKTVDAVNKAIDEGRRQFAQQHPEYAPPAGH